MINTSYKIYKTYPNPPLREVLGIKFSIYSEYKSESQDACLYAFKPSQNLRIIFQHEKEVFRVYKLSEFAAKINFFRA